MTVRHSVEVVRAAGFPVAVVRFAEPMEVLASTVRNGGMTVSDTLAVMQVPKSYDCSSPEGDLDRAVRELGLPDRTVGFMTAAEIEYVLAEASAEHQGWGADAVVTAGLSNQVVAGDLLEGWEERSRLSMERSRALTHPGTINVIAVSSAALTDSAKVNAVIAATEAKTAALNDLGYRETGTTSDAVAVVSPVRPERAAYAGTGFPLGIALARAVRGAVRRSLIKRGDFPVSMPEAEREALRGRYL